MRIDVENLHFSYNKEREILKGVTATFNEGKLTAVIGSNGCGKTTLVKCINKINIPSSGIIKFDGKDISKIPRKDIAKKIGYVPQTSGSKLSFTVMEFVLMGRCQFLGWSIKKSDIKEVEKVLEKLNILHFSNRLYSELSGGQRQKVLIARALMQQSNVFVFDEPTSNLDIKNELEIMDLAREIADNNNSVIMVVHNLNMALHYADEIILMKDGKVVVQGPTKEVITSENVKIGFGVDVEIKDGKYLNPFNNE